MHMPEHELDIDICVTLDILGCLARSTRVLMSSNMLTLCSRGPPREEQGQKEEGEADQPPPKPAEQPNFGLSGKLAAETNTFKGVALLHHEPPEVYNHAGVV